MAFLVRSVHVASVSYLLGGSLLLLILILAANHNGFLTSKALLDLMAVYEWGFWAAMGAVAMTGIGNLGAFGEGLPDASTEWGGKLAAKLFLVVAFFLFSLLRTMTLTLVSTNRTPATGVAVLEGMYGATAALAAATMAFAVALAHF